MCVPVCVCECLVAAADYKIFNFLFASEVDVIPSGYFSPPSGACRASLLARVSNSHKPIKPQLPHGQYTHTHPATTCHQFLSPLNCSLKLKSLFSFSSHTHRNLACFWHLCFIYFWWASRSACRGIQKHCQELLGSYTNQFFKSHAIYARNIWNSFELRLRFSLSHLIEYFA